MATDTQPTSDFLSRLKEQAQGSRWKHLRCDLVTPKQLIALIECAEIVQTDYLLLSSDQQMRALRVLKEFGV